MKVNGSWYLTVATLAYVIVICIVFFFRKKIKTPENKIYSVLLISTILSIIFEMLLGFYEYKMLLHISMKTFLFFCAFWVSLILFYLLTVLYGKKFEKIKNKVLFFLSCLYIILIIFIVLLPVDYHYENGVLLYSSGPAVSFAFAVAGIFLLIMIILLIKNYKRIKDNKYKPIVLFIALIIIVVVFQKSNPEYLLINFVFGITISLMYHTIENPDVYMIEQLNIAKIQADKANNAKSEFLSNMSHEIRTPLNAVVGFSESLLEENISEDAKEQARDIVTASESLLEIVNGILDISKIEANKLEIIESEYSFKKIYNDLLAISNTKLEEKNVEFKFKYDESIPNVFYGDQTRVKQIILNLLTNAIKYTKEGWIDFKVSNIIVGNKCRLIISVEDTGIGIKKENIDKLFTKFERLQVEKNTTVEGTGLGLAITKKLVELMGGKITVQSTLGKGSKFTVILDQKIVKNKVLEEKSINEVKYNNFSKSKILVVDDNVINLKVALRLLKNYNIIPVEINSGAECIERIKNEEKYDLILLDDMMPKMSGMETLKKLKEIDGFDIPVIALTANAISGMKEKYLEAGFNDYIAKPIDRKELNRVLNEYLKGDE